MFKLLSHTPYSPNFTLLDNFLFLNLKKQLGGKRFANYKEVESVVDDYFKELDDSHYKQGIEAIKRR